MPYVLGCGSRLLAGRNPDDLRETCSGQSFHKTINTLEPMKEALLSKGEKIEEQTGGEAAPVPVLMEKQKQRKP